MFEERLCGKRTVGGQISKICSRDTDDLEGEGLFIRGAGGTAAGRYGEGGAWWEREKWWGCFDCRLDGGGEVGWERS